MKTLRNKFWALLLITSVAFLSCKKEDRLSPYAMSSKKTATENTVSRNDWKITTFQVGEMSEVNLFKEYIFKFKGGEIQALTNNSSETGKWIIGRKGEMITIHFDSSPLSKLNREWNILSKTDYDIKLEQVNRKGETVSLSFQRFKRVDLPTQTEVPTDPETPTFE
ncbi:MAG: hypothetical protein K0S26_710 [Bacteroidota bacterium]|jgi:hypothetical protein|nr:hypothetical protein [Bacteroidota bacterium]